MVFSSVIFLYAFLPLTLLFYYLLPKRCSNLVLLIFSLVFYAWGEPVYILLMLYSIVLNYVSGLLMGEYPNHKKEILIFTLIMNLFVLGFFKYCNFVLENISAVLRIDIPRLDIGLPIGISFYTFQALSYIIDLYRGKYKPQKNFISFGAYITMFPQLIAGPIVRYKDIEKKLQNRKINYYKIGNGVFRFLIGLGKKVLIANQIGSLFDTVHAMGGNVSAATAWLGAIAYTLQIYFDFSGYSDMAIGLGKMMGFNFCENFDHPYISASVTEFWRRWHISLSSWFKEYVYIPLGGNRVKTWKHIRNILLVWLLTGLWHGASWNFVIWGLYYGGLLLFEKYVWSKLRIPKALGIFLTMLIVTFGWVIFTSDNVLQIFTTLKAMLGLSGYGLFDKTALYYFLSYLLTFVIAIACCLPLGKWLKPVFENNVYGRCVMFVFAMVILFACTSYLVTQNYNPFLYFQF